MPRKFLDTKMVQSHTQKLCTVKKVTKILKETDSEMWTLQESKTSIKFYTKFGTGFHTKSECPAKFRSAKTHWIKQ